MIVLENRHVRLALDETCRVTSLYCKDTERECLTGAPTPLCSVTQSRFYNNENKLSHPISRVTQQASRARREGDRLIVGFEHIPYEAVLQVTEAAEYLALCPVSFAVPEGSFEGLSMSLPPVESLRFLQLPVLQRANFGSWLNVMWDESTAVGVLAAAPQIVTDAQPCDGGRLLTAETLQSVRLLGTAAAIIATETPRFLDAVDAFERDYDLPHGVQARRDPENRFSYYAGSNVNPATVDDHIELCKKAGLRHFLVAHSSFLPGKLYEYCGDYDACDFKETYPNGFADLQYVVQRIRAAGLLPGLHFLHTHIGLKSRYVTPRADHRLRLKRHFTLRRPLGAEDTVVFVEQDPDGSPMADGCRILQFGGELIAYEAFSAEDRCFTGCTRGHLETEVTDHPVGQIGGVTDVSEFGAVSCYLDQETTLQEEIAEKLARFYDLGFAFIYFDGSEGVSAPFAVHVANAQWTVWKKLGSEPVCCEGAAKSHFSWHMLPGGNAFDVFPPPVFKEMIRRHPVIEAARMRMDFTRLNFGWWMLYDNLQPDHWEYGCAQSAAWDCPFSVRISRKRARAHAHFDDLFEVLRRWEDVRVNDLLTAQEKQAIRENPEKEWILLCNEQKRYELCEYRQLSADDSAIRAFWFERGGSRWVVFWRAAGEGALHLPAGAEIYDELYLPPTRSTGGDVSADHRRYWKTDLPPDAIRDLFP